MLLPELGIGSRKTSIEYVKTSRKDKDRTSAEACLKKEFL